MFLSNALNYTQFNKYKKQFDSAKPIQAQYSSGFSGPTPIDISYETHVSSISIPNIADGTSDMSESTSNVPQNDDIHALNTSDIGYFITSDGRRAPMSEIKRLKLAFFKTTTTTIVYSPNVSIVPNNLDVFTRQREIAQDLVVQAYRLPIGDHWEIIVPSHLSTAMARYTNHHKEDFFNASADRKEPINAAENKFGGDKSKSRECFNCKKPEWTLLHIIWPAKSSYCQVDRPYAIYRGK
ncbi:hypothetical protein [Parasitella parasitica]|uniref:Uncharacterized protein n=1 Tax=Parasitella parasitica TaxID=35722 RepID=A0A0B7MY27_9FUNG|nr:hypothetical protein [Parasitella parasitica]